MKTKNHFKLIIGLATLLMICVTTVKTAIAFAVVPEINPYIGGAVLFGASFILKSIVLPRMSLLAVLTPGDLTFNGKEIQSLGEAIFEKVFGLPTLESVHTIYTGIKAKMQIAFLGKLGLIGKKKVGCEINVNPGAITNTEKFWDPEKVEDRLSPCWDEMLDTFFIWGSNEGLRKEDLTGTDFARFLEQRWGEALEESVWRIAWFSDLNAEQVYNAGTITDGVDEDYFNIIDGLWKQLFAIGTAAPTQVTAGLATKNGQATYALQAFDSTDTTNLVATNVLDNMTYAGPMELRGDSSAVLLVTQSLADQYARERKSIAHIELAYIRVEDGFDHFFVNGVKVIPLPIWDKIIRAYFDDGSAYYLPHRAVLTSKANLGIGTESVSNFSEIDTFYDKKTKTWNMDSEYNIDAKVIDDAMVQLAY